MSLGLFSSLVWAPFDHNLRNSLVQIVRQHTHDQDFRLFRLIDQPGGLIIDAGANRGHSAISILNLTAGLRVCSFEPNPVMASSLKLIGRWFPGRHQYELCGLGDSDKHRDLLIPARGRLDPSTNASFRPSEFQKDYVQERLAEETGTPFAELKFTTRKLPVKTLDSFGLNPLAIKIDVEGLEKAVIQGGIDTIRQYKPVLMIELNNAHEYAKLLESLGYSSYWFNPETDMLAPLGKGVHPLNEVYLHPDNPVFAQKYLA
jgi:FkbM family methyltransferase